MVSKAASLMRKLECSNCDKPLDRKGRYCKACHAQWMRMNRKPRIRTFRREGNEFVEVRA
jgi:predicted amidophosphoribosyltransferase